MYGRVLYENKVVTLVSRRRVEIHVPHFLPRLLICHHVAQDDFALSEKGDRELQG